MRARIHGGLHINSEYTRLPKKAERHLLPRKLSVQVSTWKDRNNLEVPLGYALTCILLDIEEWRFSQKVMGKKAIYTQ